MYIFIQSSIRYIWYNWYTYILMIHWFLQHMFTPCCGHVTVILPLTTKATPPTHGHQVSWLMAMDFHATKSQNATHRTQKGGVYVYIDAVWNNISWMFMIHCVNVHLGFFSKCNQILDILNISSMGHSFPSVIESPGEIPSDREASWVCRLWWCALGRTISAVQKPVAEMVFVDFPVWRWQIYGIFIRIWCIWLYSISIYIYNELCIV